MAKDSIIETDPLLDAFGECTPPNILDRSLIRDRILRYLDGIVDVYNEQFAGYKNLRLNRALLRETIESCICDIYRLKFFRGIHQEDNHKRAAFFMVWLAKIKPVQPNENSGLCKGDICANELLAIFFGLTILDISPKWLYSQYPTYMRNMVYLLHHRGCAPEQLASELFLLDQLRPKV